MMAGETLVTKTTVLDELLAELVSAEDNAATLTTLVTRPGVVAVAVMVKATPAEDARLPRLQVMTPLWLVQAPGGKLATPEVSPAGNGSVTITLMALSGPRLVTAMV